VRPTGAVRPPLQQCAPRCDSAPPRCGSAGADHRARRERPTTEP
jgi:hypothetical protein